MHAHNWQPKPSLRRLLGRWGSDLAIDLGTATTLVYVRDGGIILAEPSIAAVDRDTQEVLAIGHAAQALVRKEPATTALLQPGRRGGEAEDHVRSTRALEFPDRRMEARAGGDRR